MGDRRYGTLPMWQGGSRAHGRAMNDYEHLTLIHLQDRIRAADRRHHHDGARDRTLVSHRMAAVHRLLSVLAVRGAR